MKIVYVANIRVPTEKAHGLQIFETCEALADLGQEVILLVPRRRSPIKEDPYDFYRVKRNFKIIKLACFDSVDWGHWGFWLESLSFGLSVLFFTRTWTDDFIFFSRDEVNIFLLGLKKRKLFWEVHDGRINWLIKKNFASLRGIVSITSNLKDFYQKKGFPDRKILVAPDAVDLGKFSLSVTKMEARDILSLPQEKKLIVYTGHLYEWKGAHILAQSASDLPLYNFLFVGGTEKDVRSFKLKYRAPNIFILGQRPHSDIPYFLKAADLLILPNSGHSDISRLYTSPMKLFEYMASGTPIIASSLPSIQEVLNSNNACLVEPDNSELLTGAIVELLSNQEKAESLARQASLDVLAYSWVNRARALVNFFENQ